ncbi:hypothetical protein ACGF13_05255 [Kitasatospora sp. NPDC048286]|uniref:hypothetical protein n=1 Tax=unclassified Kitasatospora TaxID=2633591 RepID=UPI003710BAF3
MSARWLTGLGIVAFLLPMLAMAASRRMSAPAFYLPALLCVAVCAVPSFFRRRDRFRIACAAAGMTVAAVSAPPGVLGLLFAVFAPGWGWLLYLAFLALPVTAIAALIAGFQRAKGRDSGRRAVAVAWAATAITVTGWGYIGGLATA